MCQATYIFFSHYFMYSLSANLRKASRKSKSVFNVVCNGSPSRIRIVRLISLGITTRPRSSIRRTIPVAFIILTSICINKNYTVFSQLCFYYLRNLSFYSVYFFDLKKLIMIRLKAISSQLQNIKKYDNIKVQSINTVIKFNIS